MKKRILSLMIAVMLLMSSAVCHAEGSPAAGGYPWLNSSVYGNVTEGMAIDPKDDFHLAANYEKLLSIRLSEDMPAYSAALAAEDQLNEKLLRLMTDDTLEGRDARNIRRLYNAFLDTDAREAFGVAPLLDIVQTISQLSSIDDVTALMLDEEASKRIAFPFSVSTAIGLNDPDRYIASLSFYAFMLGDAEEYRELSPYGEVRKTFVELEVLYILQRCGFTYDQADEMLSNALAAEGLIAAEAMTAEDKYSPDYYARINNELTPDEADALLPAFPLKQMMEARGYGSVDVIWIKDLGSLKGFNRLYTDENLPLLKDYMTVMSCMLLMNYLDSGCDEAIQRAEDFLFGIPSESSRETSAVRLVCANLSGMVQRCYLQKYDLQGTKAVITDLCRQVIDQYRVMLAGEEWLSDETRAQALNKLDNMKIFAVYPDKWVDDTALELTEDMNFFECMMAIIDWQKARARELLGTTEDPDLANQNFLSANASYDPYSNSINVYLGILSDDYYPEDGCIEKLYGGLGTVIGHEISHAFDRNGAQFGADGTQTDWWTEEDYQHFDERVTKAAAYYDGITLFEGMNVNGMLVIPEAMADMSGVKCILMMAEDIEGFDYDLFFRSFANIHTSVLTPEVIRFVLSADPHPADYLRTNVTLQQFDRFLDTYGITEGDGMYLPENERILVW